MMVHVFTRISNVDVVWLKGIACLLKMCGGGKITPSPKGFEVWARQPWKFLRSMRNHTRSFPRLS